jgi:hypothetical protein
MVGVPCLSFFAAGRQSRLCLLLSALRDFSPHQGSPPHKGQREARPTLQGGLFVGQGEIQEQESLELTTPGASPALSRKGLLPWPSSC